MLRSQRHAWLTQLRKVFGYDTGWMSGVLAMPYFITLYTGVPYNYETGQPVGVRQDTVWPIIFRSIPDDFHPVMRDLLRSALISGDVADYIGRRPTIIVGCIVFCFGCILEIASTNQEALFVMGRLMAGLGMYTSSALLLPGRAKPANRALQASGSSAPSSSCTCLRLAPESSWGTGLGLSVLHHARYLDRELCRLFLARAATIPGSCRIPVGGSVPFWAIILAVGLLFLRECPWLQSLLTPLICAAPWFLTLFLVAESPRYHVKRGELDLLREISPQFAVSPSTSDYISGRAGRNRRQPRVRDADHASDQLPADLGWPVFKGSIRKGNSNLRRTILGAGLKLRSRSRV